MMSVANRIHQVIQMKA